ncbi:MAG: DIP1984 family protein [Tepidiformaceae bacterium]
MKLAEALVQRADAQKRLLQIKQRAIANARIQDGEEPTEDPAELVAQYDRIAADFQALVERINRTNLASEVEPGVSITAAIARRDVLAMRRGLYTDLANTATVRQDRYSRSEVKFVPVVDVRDLQGRADDIARQYRELDTAIQATNWAVELLD